MCPVYPESSLSLVVMPCLLASVDQAGFQNGLLVSDWFQISRRQFENHQSGRSSAAKLATFIQDYECFQLEITRTYSLNDFKDDMKKLLLS